MLNFSVGPVMSSESVCAIGAEQVPYFRTAEFSAVMKENEQLVCRFAKAGSGARAVFLTGSGTASMEAAVINAFSASDHVLVVNGGSFGQRFADICAVHEIPCTQIVLTAGKPLTEKDLAAHDGKGYTGFLVNLHETSTGVKYDLDLISAFCRRNGLFLIVDAISSFLADPIDMQGAGIDMLLAGSQKALACPPGISLIVFSARGVERTNASHARSFYFNLKDALLNGERGQTPFTPAVGILLQIHERLKQIEAAGGVENEILRTASLAQDFRSRIAHLPLAFFSESPSNACTALHPLNASANEIFLTLKDEYGIWVCPNGGAMKDTVFRVGHLGALTPADNAALVQALDDLHRRGLL